MTDHRPTSQHNRSHKMLRDDAPLAREYVEYHWGRIFAALALVAGGIYGAKALLGNSEEPSVALLGAVGTPEEVVVAEVTNVDASEPTPATVSSELREAEVVAPAPAIAESTSSVENTTPEPSTQDDLQMLEGEVAGDQALVASVPEATVDTAHVEILAPGLARAQLTHRLEDKEPVDELPQKLVMNDQGLLHIYLFTETQDLKGQLLFHDWYLDGKRLARVRIRPYSDQMRASSSKFIDRHMTGDWRVEVVKASGERLAIGEFVVLP